MTETATTSERVTSADEPGNVVFPAGSGGYRSRNLGSADYAAGRASVHAPPIPDNGAWGTSVTEDTLEGASGTYSTMVNENVNHRDGNE